MHRSLITAFRLGCSSPLARSHHSPSKSPLSPVIQAPCVATQTIAAESPAEEVVISEESQVMPQELLQFAPRKYIEFTCTVCQNRVAKTFSKQAYERGTVLIRCSGCQNLHLIADHINFTGFEEKTIEEIAAKKGEPVTNKWDGDLLQSAFQRGK